jgi:hypothetical protein
MKALIGALLTTTLVALGIASPAMSAPQGPWVLPAADLSPPGQDAVGSQITTAPDGTATAVWRRNDGANSIIQSATRPPGGTFGTPVNLSAAGQDAFGPQIRTDPGGTSTAVWSRSDGANSIIQSATRPPGGEFNDPVDLSAPGQTAVGAQITIAPDGTTTAIWQRSNGSNFIIQAATRPPGGTFGTPADLSVSGQDALNAEVTTDPGGTTTAVWRRSNGTNSIIQAATRPPGGSFGIPVDLSAPGQNASGPRVMTVPDGTTTAVWERSDGSNNIIQAATRPPGGTFGAPVDLSAAGQDAFGPGIASSPDGVATVVWSLFKGGNFIIQGTTRPPGGTFGLPVDLSAAGQDAFGPEISADPAGTTTAVWQRSNGTNSIIQAATRPPGGTFGAPVDLSAPGQDALLPQIASSLDGVATAVWQRSNGTNSIIQSVSTERPQPAKPRLSNLKIKPKSKKVRRGRKATFKVKVRNTGEATAKKLKLCVKGPKKLVKVPKCRKPGNLAPGKSKTVKFKVKVKNRAKKGRKAKITFTAYAKGAKKKSGRATVKIR